MSLFPFVSFSCYFPAPNMQTDGKYPQHGHSWNCRCFPGCELMAALIPKHPPQCCQNPPNPTPAQMLLSLQNLGRFLCSAFCFPFFSKSPCTVLFKNFPSAKPSHLIFIGTASHNDSPVSPLSRIKALHSWICLPVLGFVCSTKRYKWVIPLRICNRCISAPGVSALWAWQHLLCSTKLCCRSSFCGFEFLLQSKGMGEMPLLQLSTGILLLPIGDLSLRTVSFSPMPL